MKSSLIHWIVRGIGIAFACGIFCVLLYLHMTSRITHKDAATPEDGGLQSAAFTGLRHMVNSNGLPSVTVAISGAQAGLTHSATFYLSRGFTYYANDTNCVVRTNTEFGVIRKLLNIDLGQCTKDIGAGYPRFVGDIGSGRFVILFNHPVAWRGPTDEQNVDICIALQAH